ncbi:MAG TPA: glucose 1-dehydrogenase [Verrucomicrobiae bacterium]|nr:glucose 1-dehydrogenase [Verrucomicrobiae bacterium]
MTTSAKSLANKTAVVTGASKGIGAAIAKHLAHEGAAVVVNYSSSKEDADRVVDEIAKHGGQAVAIHANLARQSDINRLFAETEKALGKIDILVNNAGTYEFRPLADITEDHFRKQFDLNVLGLLLATQQAVRHFRDSGGSIINISSLVSRYGVPNASVYSATKGAVDALTRGLAVELGPRKIRVNAINPGMVETEGLRAAGVAESDMRKSVESQTPLGRIGHPSDIAAAAVFLASPESEWMTGQTLHINGGFR